MSPLRRALLLVGGCLVLGIGVALMLAVDLGSDGYSTLLYGLTLASGWPFWLIGLLVGVVFLAMAALRGVYPGLGTVVQVVMVGVTVSWLLPLLPRPAGLPSRLALLAVALVVLAVGIAAYLGSHTGAGPTEAAALAWDPPLPFRWSYAAVQGGGAVAGWVSGATIGVGTVAVILLLGPLVDLSARVLRVDVHQSGRSSDADRAQRRANSRIRRT